MNVRFFGGCKEEYVSIPKHNPIGLYFCADTRELFLGDRLLSDGLRVVSTFADLPSISEHKAAEGIIYFVEDTKNGYVLPRGRSEWLQVIYAPATDVADLSNYYTKVEVDEAILEAIANIKVEVDLTAYALKSDIPSIEGLATEQYVIDAIAAQVPVEELAKKEEVVEVKTKLETEVLPTIKETILPTVQELTKTAATEEWVKGQGYLTEHQSLDAYATTAVLNSALAIKADDIPFNTSMFVGKALGGFGVGDDLKGLSISKILAKLLELSDVNQEPGSPDEPAGIIENIISKQMPMLEIDENSMAIELPYVYQTFERGSDDDASKPVKTSFYQITENGEVVESGYQHVSSENDSMYYLIALPKDMDFNTNVTVYCYDTLVDPSNPWQPVDGFAMSSDPELIAQMFADAGLPIPNIDQNVYRLWIDESGATYNGSIYRFIINE